MKTKNYYLLIAGGICLFTALLHTIGGQIDLVNPMMESDLKIQTKTELLGVWHMVTIMIFIGAYVLLRNGLNLKGDQIESVRLTAWLFILFGIAFVIVSIFNGVLAPQWILCFPIGILALLGLKKAKA